MKFHLYVWPSGKLHLNENVPERTYHNQMQSQASIFFLPLEQQIDTQNIRG